MSTQRPSIVMRSRDAITSGYVYSIDAMVLLFSLEALQAVTFAVKGCSRTWKPSKPSLMHAVLIVFALVKS
jgi:hypothetical protein